MPGQGPSPRDPQGMPYGPPAGAPQAQPYGHPYGMPQDRPQGRPAQVQPPQGPFDAPSRIRRRLLWASAITGGVVILLTGVIAVTGGFASDSALKQVPVGESIDQNQFKTTVIGGYWTKNASGREMVARMRVTNTGDKTVSLNDFLKAAIPLQAWKRALISTINTEAYTGGSKTDELTPGIPVDVRAHYLPDPGQGHATRLTLRFCGIEHRSDFYYQGHQVWVEACEGWGSFDPRETVAPQDISGPGVTWQQKVQKANELHRQGEATRKKRVFNTDGVIAQVNVPLKGAS